MIIKRIYIMKKIKLYFILPFFCLLAFSNLDGQTKAATNDGSNGSETTCGEVPFWSGSNISTYTSCTAQVGGSSNVTGTVGARMVVWPNGGDTYGIRIMGGAPTYGIHSLVTGAGKYAVYGRANTTDSYAGYFGGRVLMEESLLFEGSAATWSVSQGGSDLVISTFEDGVGPNSGNSLVMQTDGKMVKNYAGADDAFTIVSNDETNFKVTGEGKVYAREVEVTMDPLGDYVFDEDYPLMPLDELKKYINENHHLPGVPSAEEVAQNGIGLGDLAGRELVKIEELTLYLLQLSDKLEVLKAENEMLLEEVKKIKGMD